MHQKGAKGMRQPKLHKWADKFTEILIYFMLLFSPWAFGTTQQWSIRTMKSVVSPRLIAVWNEPCWLAVPIHCRWSAWFQRLSFSSSSCGNCGVICFLSIGKKCLIAASGIRNVTPTIHPISENPRAQPTRTGAQHGV